MYGTWVSTVVPKNIAHGSIEVKIDNKIALVNLKYLGVYKY